MQCTAIKQLKKNLRKDIAERLSGLSENSFRDQCEQVYGKLKNLPIFTNAKRIGIYLSIPGKEVDTENIVKECLLPSKGLNQLRQRQLFIPRYRLGGTEMEMLMLHSWNDFENLPVEPRYQIRQPSNDDDSRPEALATGGLDLLIVPGVAFTPNGLRLGHGKGYYDRWLARCFATPGIRYPKLIGLALREQIVTDIPVTQYDFPMDIVLYPDQ